MHVNFVEQCERFAQKNFSISNLRPAQREVLKLIFEKKYILATLPTGAGKTLLYSLPALIFQQEVVLVVSPLISLMRDQERRMNNANIPCAIFTSEQSDEERAIAWQKLNSKEAKIFFVSPERFVLPSFLKAIVKIKIGMVVVDEAHCVISWGHHFRPEYSEIGKILSTVIEPQRILAITATASRHTRQDIIKQVFPEHIQVSEYISQPISKNIFVESVRSFSKIEQWDQLVHIIQTTKSFKVLVYFQTRTQCEEATLKLKKLKINAVAYHAGLLKVERKNVEEYVHVTLQKTIICATSAFGMGIDVSNLCLVVVFGFPANIEEFFQMLGRAGRSGEESKGVLLWTGADPIKREYQFKASFPDSSSLLNQSEFLIDLFPKNYGESCFIQNEKLLSNIKGNNEAEKQKKIAGLLGALRICNVLEDTRIGESYFQIQLGKNISFNDILLSLPEGVSKRRKVLEGFSALLEKEWFFLRGAQAVVSVKRLKETCGMEFEVCEQVFSYYQQEQKIFLFDRIGHDFSKHGVILKNGYKHLQKELPRYISARSHFHASLQELQKLSTAKTCRLASSFDFFAERAVRGASKKSEVCMHCDICIKKRK